MSMPSPNERAPRHYLRPPTPIVFPTGGAVPETKRHLEIRTALYVILKLALADRAMIGSDQFVYWDPTNPSECLAPDVFVRLGEPDELFDSWKVWERGAPHVAVEIISASDDGDVPWSAKLGKYHRLGVREVVRFDPESAELRIWDSIQGDLVERMLTPGESVECVPLALYWVVAPSVASEVMLRLSRDAAGKDLLPTTEDEREAARAEREAARAEREVALHRVRILEEELRRRG